MAYGQDNPNGLKTYPSLRMGTPELTWIFITIDGAPVAWEDEPGDYAVSDSYFSRAITAIERYCDIYNIDRPDASTFAVQVRANSVPLTGSETLGSGDSISVLQDAILEYAGVPVTATGEVLALTPPVPVIYLGTNSYITFGTGDDVYGDDLSPSSPAYPKIAVGADDNSLQIMYYGTVGSAPNRTYVIRYEGTDSTGGEAYASNMLIEYHFPEATPHLINIHIIANARGGGYLSGVYSADGNFALAFDSVNAGDSWQWNNNDQTLTAITHAPNGSEGLSMFYMNDTSGMGNEPPYEDWSEDDGFVSVPIPWAIPFLGTTYTPGTGIL